MAAKPMLDDIELQLVQDIEGEEGEALAEHGVPALEGDFVQDLGRRASRVSLTGVMVGEEVADALKTLRDKFRVAEPVSFVADIATATKVDKVLIEEMGVRGLAGKPERFEYTLTLREFIPPPPTRQEEPPPPPPPPSVDTGTLVVEVIVEGQPNFDFSKVTVMLEGTQDDGAVLSRTLTNRDNNIWTEEDFPPGQYTAEAVVTEPQPMSGSTQAAVRAGQTTQAQITLRAGAVVATTFLVHFRFDNAFLEPCMREVIRQVAEHAANNTDEKLLIVGHTDKTGSNQYNQSLSERRARSVFACLTFGRDRTGALSEWNALRAPRQPPNQLPSVADNWDVREYQHILQDLGFYPGAVDGQDGPLTQDAVRAYRCHKGLPAGTTVDDEVWNELIQDYLGQDSLAIPESQFLPNCSGEILKWLGCGEEDPVNNTAAAHRPNRRTELLFVRTDRLPCQVPKPDTFDLPVPGAVNNNWCLGPGSTSGHCCIVSPHLQRGTNTPQPCPNDPQGPWCRQPAESATITVEGSIQRELPDGTLLEPVPNQAFVLIAPNGQFKAGEQSNGEPTPARTKGGTGADRGTFSFPDMPTGFFSLEVRTPASAPVLVRLRDGTDADIKGNAVCKRLTADDHRLEVVIVNAPVLREIRLPVVAHLMTALHPVTREIRTCPAAVGPPTRQSTAITDAELRAAFDEANRIWRQARIRFELDDANVVRETYAFRTECEVDESEFTILLQRCAYPDAVNVFLIGDLAGLGEAGFGVSLEGGAALGVAGCAVGDRFQTTILGPPLSLTLDAQQRAQVLAHELGHFLNLEHADDTPANASRLMLPGTFSATNRTLIRDEVNRARASRGATDDCVPLSLQVTGATRIGGSLGHQFVVIQNPTGVVIVDAQIPDRLIAPGVGTLTMTGGNPGATPLQRTVSGATPGATDVIATYTPASGNPPVTARAVVQVVNFTLRVEGACQLGAAASTNFISVQSANSDEVITVSAEIDPGPFCVPDNLVTWSGGVAAADPLRRKVARTNPGPVPISATLAGVTRTVTLQVVTFTLRVEGATQIGPPADNTFVVVHDPTAAVTVIAEINPTPALLLPDIVTWVGGAATANPLRRRVPRTPTGEFPVRATVCGVTRQVTIQVVAIVTITKTAPARPAFDEISNANEPVLTVCGTAPATLRIDVTPDAARIFYTTNPNNVVDLNPTDRVGDGEVIIQPRALPAGTNRVSGRDTRLSLRIVNATGPETFRNGQPARVRIRQFERVEAHLLLHVVRDDAGNLPGTTLATVVNTFNTALTEANTLWGRACISLVPRRTAAGVLDIDFIDETDLLDISATFDGTGGVTFPDNENDTLFTQGGVNRNTANPTFINLYLIDRFDGAPTLGGFASGNSLIIVKTMSGSLLAHELGHCLGLPDLDNVAGITDLAKRQMRSATPRGEILTSSGTAGDEINTARNRATTFTG